MARASTLKPDSCWRPSTTGSPRALTRRTYARPRDCSKRCPDPPVRRRRRGGKKPQGPAEERVYNASIVACRATGAKGSQVADTNVGDMHRIGGGSVENLRLKARETTLNPPGISLLRAPSPEEAARQMWEAFPAAEGLHEAAQVIGSTTVEKIRQVGFDGLPNPTKKLPNHYRLIHPEGIAGFHDVNLARLSAVFTETSGHAACFRNASRLSTPE